MAYICGHEGFLILNSNVGIFACLVTGNAEKPQATLEETSPFPHMTLVRIHLEAASSQENGTEWDTQTWFLPPNSLIKLLTLAKRHRGK